LMQSFKAKLYRFLGLKSVVQLKRFLITGGISTIISYFVFLASLRFFHLHYMLANLCSFVLSIIFAYNCNKHWSFSGPHHKSNHLAEYLVVYFTTLGVSMIILKITIDGLGIIPEISFFISLCFTTGMNFFGLKFLVFKK